MAAESDGVVLVAAVRVAAVAVLKLGQREQPRPDSDATEFHRLGRLWSGGCRPGGAGGTLAALLHPVTWCLVSFLDPRYQLQTILGTPRDDQPHPFGSSDRGAAAVGRTKPRIDRVGSIRIGHAAPDKFPERRRMLRRPTK